MKNPRAVAITFAMIMVALVAGVQNARLQDAADTAAQKLELTTAQRSAIYATVSKDKSKVSPQRFSTVIGAEVPPMIELYALPDDIVAGNTSATFYKLTMVLDQVVLVDPTKMRVVDTIGPPQQ